MVKGPGGERILNRRSKSWTDLPNWILALITILLGWLIGIGHTISQDITVIKTSQATYLNQQKNDEDKMLEVKADVTAVKGEVQGNTLKVQMLQDKLTRRGIQ